MKELSTIFLLFCAYMLAFPAFSLSKSELVGTWTWSSIGCRDSNLSTSSHRPIADNNQNPDLVSEATFVFNSNGSASMNSVQGGDSINLGGTFEIVSNGNVVNMIPTGKDRSDESAKFKLNVVNDGTRLAVVRCPSDYEREKKIPDMDQGEIDQKIEVLRNTCGENRCFVYLIGKV